MTPNSDRLNRNFDLTRGEHPGLLLQRFLRRPLESRNSGQDSKTEQLKKELFGSALTASRAAALSRPYKLAFDRFRQSWPELTETVELATPGRDSRLIVGLGSENVVETGLTLHHTYGVPVIPGSALKGLASHYAITEWGPSDKDFARNGKIHNLLFGATEDSGVILFHDAWFVPGSTDQPLVPDVMTPHHQEWNEGKSPPTDFDSPVPVPFLAVTGRFRIALSWVGPESDQAAPWTRRALELLIAALEDWGVGGKTSSGYGRLLKPEKIRGSIPASTSSAARQPNLAASLKAGETVEVELLEKNAKGTWKARERRTGAVGFITDSASMSVDPQAGQVVSVRVSSVSADGKQIMFSCKAGPPPGGKSAPGKSSR
jgi:CRISPR type III-B/RAMP module RAMP protein Cmr6